MFTLALGVTQSPTMFAKFFNTVPMSQKLAAWGTAGAIFGAWTYYENRNNGKLLSSVELEQRNKRIGGDKLKKNKSTNQ